MQYAAGAAAMQAGEPPPESHGARVATSYRRWSRSKETPISVAASPNRRGRSRDASLTDRVYAPWTGGHEPLAAHGTTPRHGRPARRAGQWRDRPVCGRECAEGVPMLQGVLAGRTPV